MTGSGSGSIFTQLKPVPRCQSAAELSVDDFLQFMQDVAYCNEKLGTSTAPLVRDIKGNIEKFRRALFTNQIKLEAKAGMMRSEVETMTNLRLHTLDRVFDDEATLAASTSSSNLDVEGSAIRATIWLMRAAASNYYAEQLSIKSVKEGRGIAETSTIGGSSGSVIARSGSGARANEPNFREFSLKALAIVCEPHYNFMQKHLVRSMTLLCPSRTKHLQLLDDGRVGNEMQTLSEMETYMNDIPGLLSVLFRLLEEYKVGLPVPWPVLVGTLFENKT